MAARPQINTIIIFTTQMDVLASFYRQAFQLGEPNASGEDHLGFAMPNLYLGFDQVSEPVGLGSSAVSLWFDVEDLEQTFEQLVAMGSEVRYGPTRKPWGGYLACVYDPDGNMIGLSQPAKQGQADVAGGSAQ